MHFTFRISVELDGMFESPWSISTGIDSKGAIAFSVPNILRKHSETALTLLTSLVLFFMDYMLFSKKVVFPHDYQIPEHELCPP